MNIRGPGWGDVNRPIQNRLPPAPVNPTTIGGGSTEVPSGATVPVETFSDQYIANSALLPKTEKKNNNDDVDDAWSPFAVEPDANANAVLPPVLNAKQGVALQLTKPPEGKEPVVIAEFMKLAGTNGSNAAIAATIIDGLA